MYFHVSDRAALPRISATVYAAGLSEHQKTLLSEQGAAVADYTGAESGTVILGAGCTDQTLLEKASSAKNLILLAPQNFGFAGLPVEASEAPMPAVFGRGGRIHCRFCRGGRLPDRRGIWRHIYRRGLLRIAAGPGRVRSQRLGGWLHGHGACVRRV